MCVYLFVLTLSVGLCVLVAHKCDLCELSVGAAERIAFGENEEEKI